jgi:hypothetical protein
VIDQHPWQTALLIAVRSALLNLGAIDEAALQATVQAADSAPSWWNSQARAIALDAHVETAFADFSPKGSFRFVSEDVVRNRLLGGILCADLAGDESRYVHESKLVARLIAIESRSAPRELADAIEILHECRDSQAITNVASRLLEVGGYEELKGLWKGAEDECWWQVGAATTSLAKAVLTVLPEVEVSALAKAICDALATSRQFHTIDSADTLSLLSATVGLGSLDSSTRALDELFRLHVGGDENAARNLVSALRRVDDEVVRLREADVERLAEDPDDSLALVATQRLSSVGQERATQRLVQRASRGELGALAFVFARGEWSDDLAPAAVVSVSQRLRDALDRARSWIRPGDPWTFDFATRVASRTGDLQLWQLVVGGLADAQVGGDEKSAAVVALLGLWDPLPPEIREALLAVRGSVDAGHQWDPTEPRTSTAALRHGIGQALDLDEHRDVAVSLCIASPEPLARQIGAAIALRHSRCHNDHRGAALSLQALLADDDLDVLRVAVQGIVEIACRDDDTLAWLGGILTRFGPLASRYIVQQLAVRSSGQSAAPARTLLAGLTSHDDPYVSRVAGRALAEPE